jgi:hypothetical protein
MAQNILPRRLAVGRNMVRRIHRPLNLVLIIAAAGRGQKLGVVDKVKVMDGDDAPPRAAGGGNEVGAVQHVQAVGQQFGRQRPALQAMVAGCPQVAAAEVGGGREVGTAILAAVKQRVAIAGVELRQRRQQMHHVLANASHLVIRQAAIDPYLHTRHCKLIQPKRKAE